MRLHDLATPPVRLRFNGRIDELTEALALKAAFLSAHLFGVAAGIHLRHLRAMNDPLMHALAQAKEEQFKASCLARAHADPTAKTVGATVRQSPPITRFADAVRNTVHLMVDFGFGSDETTSLVLARAGWKISPRSVARIRKERPRPKPVPPTSNPPHQTTHPVIARFVHHVWMMDVTQIQAFLGGTLYLASVFDTFSRVPLVLQTYNERPGASARAKLLKSATRAFGRAKYLVTDQGGEFKGSIFRKTAARLGVLQRFRTKGRIFATARLERFWRTLKEMANLKILQPLTIDDLERRLEATLTEYLCFRPHQGLEGATPAEAFLGVEAASQKAVSPPRARKAEGPQEMPFTIGFLDPDTRAFPILNKAA